MNDMRKLMETVAPLFEDYDPKLIKMLADFERNCEELRYYGDTDVVTIDKLLKAGRAEDAAEEMAGAMSDQDGGSDKFDHIYDMAKDAVDDYMHQEPAMAEQAVSESNVEAIEELENILDELERLGEQARYAVRSISREAEQQLSAYGAFDFGSSSNQYDVALASFLDDAQSGSYDERD